VLERERAGVAWRRWGAAAVGATLGAALWVFLLSRPVEATVAPLGVVPLAGEGLTLADHAGMALLFGVTLVYLLRGTEPDGL
jgi:hypothetical protein